MPARPLTAGRQDDILFMTRYSFRKFKIDRILPAESLTPGNNCWASDLDETVKLAFVKISSTGSRMNMATLAGEPDGGWPPAHLRRLIYVTRSRKS
ncbi:MAG: hypothetical protein ABI472_22665 [Ginsengibacter sp.]